MRHAMVTRAAMVLAAALLVGAVAFAWLVGGDAVPSGADPFQRRCGSCHTAGDLTGTMQVSGDAARAMETFLRDHADVSDEESGQILDYFASAGSATGR